MKSQNLMEKQKVPTEKFSVYHNPTTLISACNYYNHENLGYYGIISVTIADPTFKRYSSKTL